MIYNWKSIKAHAYDKLGKVYCNFIAFLSWDFNIGTEKFYYKYKNNIYTVATESCVNSSIKAHTSNFNNPHHTTAHQVGTYTTAEIDGLIPTKTSDLTNDSGFITINHNHNLNDLTEKSYNSLTDKPTIPSAQIQSDWNQTDNGQFDYIKNKPTIPTVITDHSLLSNLDYVNSGHSGFQSELGFTPEDADNKVTAFQVTPDDTHYPSEKLVYDTIALIDESKWEEVSPTLNVPYNYGNLYNWYVANNSNFAPTNYRIPNTTDASILITYIGATPYHKMRSTRTSPTAHPRWDSPNTGALDSFNFNGLPSSIRQEFGNFVGIGTNLDIWISDEFNATYGNYIYCDTGYFYVTQKNKKAGLSIRIMRDAIPSEQLLNDGDSCGSVQDYDGNWYNTVKIGTQVWVTQNWKCTKLNDGTPIANITDQTDWQNAVTGAYCTYNNDPLSTYEDPTYFYTVNLPSYIQPKQIKQVSIGESAISDNYLLPNSRGSNGQILKTDGSGIVTWEDDINTDSLADLTDVDLTESKTTPIDADNILLQDSEDSSIWKNLTWANTKATLKTYFDNIYIPIANLIGFKKYHGVVRADIRVLPTHITSTTFTLNTTAYPHYYFYDGTRVYVNADKSCTLTDGTAGLYYVYFDGATGNILATKNFPGLTNTSNVLIANVVWNGTDYGLVSDERHGYDRDLAWHLWAHTTVGVRYKSGIDFAPTGTGAGATFTSTAGELADEDIVFQLPASSSFPTANAIRTWYQTGASTYVFDNTTSLIPYRAGTDSRPQYVNSTGYALTTMTSAVNRYINVWIYGTQDNHTPLYSFVETVTNAIAGTNGYTSVANARAIPFPNLSGLGLSPELKPLYRMIVRADGAIQALTAADDYRLVSSLPMSAGSVATSAGAVTFAPYDDITATNVQQAGQQLADQRVKLGASSIGQYASDDFEQAIATSTFNVAWSNGNVQYIQLTNGSNTIDFTAPLTGGRYILVVKQPSSGAAGTVGTWDSDILWGDAGIPTLSTTNDKIDVFSFVYGTLWGSKYIGNYSKGF